MLLRLSRRSVVELTEHGLHAVCSDWLASGWYESLEHGMAFSAVHQKPGSHDRQDV